MKEKPILFSTEMVKAILEGRKTQTRRVIKPIPKLLCVRDGAEHWTIPNYGTGEWVCLYGQVCDRLWVRETWGLLNTEPKDGKDKATIYYKATDGNKHVLRYQKWRPSIFMPRWASRITLGITDIRVQRLQEISETDCIAEGIPQQIPDYWESHYKAYSVLWDSINFKRGYSWESNPFVWAITFKRIE